MSTEQTVVIVGASLAGAKAAETLHHEGFDGRVVMVGEEAERPYERPPLSQDLTGQAARPPSCELGPLSRSRQTDTPPPCGNVVPVDSPGNEAGEDRRRTAWTGADG